MKRYLPVGTVFRKVISDDKKYMIVSRITKKSDTDLELYDYCACLIPEGITETEKLLFINHQEIGQLLFIGFQDEEELQYSVALAQAKEEYQKKIEE